MRALRLPGVVFACSLLIVLVVSGCRRAEQAEPTAFPTATFTPRSTPLPTVATPPPPGAADNPMQLLFTRPAAVSRGAAASAAEELQTVLSEASNLVLNVVIADSGAEAVAALCDSTGGTPSAAWVDGVTYAAARTCAERSLAVVREDGAGADVVIIVPQNSDVTSPRELAGTTFCRLGVDDLYTWIVPTLIMAANNFSPTNLGAIVDYEDLNDLVSDVGSGDCGAAGVNVAELESIGGSSRIRALGDPERVPYAILMMPPAIPLGARIALADAIIAIAADAEQSQLLNPLLDQDRIATIGDDELRTWDAFLRSTRLDFSEMAR